MAYFHPIYTRTLKINAKHPLAQTVRLQNTLYNTLYGQHTLCNYNLSEATWSIEVNNIDLGAFTAQWIIWSAYKRKNENCIYISMALEPISAAAIPIPSESKVTQGSGPRLNIKTVFPRYGDSHVKDKTVMRPSYLSHGDPYTGKTTYLYWDGPRVASLLPNSKVSRPRL